MKANIINGKVEIFTSLPNDWKHYLNFREADEATLRSEGFYDVITPLHDTRHQRLGELIFHEDKKIFIYELEDIIYDLNEIKQRHYNDLFETLKEISSLATHCKNVYDPLGLNPENLPEALRNLILMIAGLRHRAHYEIESLDNIDDALDYVIRGPEIEGLINYLKSFL